MLNDENGDNIASAGETIEITITQENVGTNPTSVAYDHEIFMFDSPSNPPALGTHERHGRRVLLPGSAGSG